MPEITLSLISHTNVGKTALFRTLLRKDVGIVCDRTHVTEIAEKHVLMRTDDGVAMALWDTPGFGDSFRLWQRLKQSDGTLSAFLTELWDRTVNRPMWCSQQAMLNVRDHADVVLYLVDTSVEPAEAGYIEPEMEIVKWLGKPFMVLLNQLGSPRNIEEQHSDPDLWQQHFDSIGVSAKVMPFDAFARCWVQEGTLWNEVRKLLPASHRPRMDKCIEYWQRRSEKCFEQAINHLDKALTAIILDSEALPSRKLADKVSGLIRRDFGKQERRQAAAQLEKRAAKALNAAMSEIIALHGLSGEAKRIVEARLQDIAVRWLLGRRGVVAALVTGAGSGLAFDLAAGGLTFGVGTLVGLTGGAAVAGSINYVKGGREACLNWRYIAETFDLTVLCYLEVAHFGRGRGEWSESEPPKFWSDTVEEVTRPMRKHIKAEVVRMRRSGTADASGIRDILEEATRQTLTHLYPPTGEGAGAASHQRKRSIWAKVAGRRSV